MICESILFNYKYDKMKKFLYTFSIFKAIRKINKNFKSDRFKIILNQSHAPCTHEVYPSSSNLENSKNLE